MGSQIFAVWQTLAIVTPVVVVVIIIIVVVAAAAAAAAAAATAVVVVVVVVIWTSPQKSRSKPGQSRFEWQRPVCVFIWSTQRVKPLTYRPNETQEYLGETSQRVFWSQLEILQEYDVRGIHVMRYPKAVTLDLEIIEAAVLRASFDKFSHESFQTYKWSNYPLKNYQQLNEVCL